jgi:hypothetical protein
MASAPDSPGKKASLDGPPAPPELRVRKGIGGVVASRDAEQNGGPDNQQGTMPGMGGPNAIGTRAMAVEQAIGALAQVMPDPAPLTDILARFRAVVVSTLQSSATPQPPPGQGLSGVVAPPALIAPPAMSGPGMPAPPPM